MSDPFVAEIRMFAGNFAPTGWAFCNGQILPISQNTALFSLLGTTYGGDGKSTFALPNLQQRIPLQPGQGAGLSLYDLGQTGGSATVTLTTNEIPVHSHTLQATSAPSNKTDPAGNILASARSESYQPPATPPVTMNPGAMAIAGASQPHNNLQPYLVVNFIIALQGVYPPRS
ncbi:phage tail protein [Oculatella sp. LEGE 06141]|uniref:phage tail protein n=1 Tax=Oculatella sp. LEGE 06141 TaxID=1828648 RepID=UPI00187FE2A5|nr:tail fiber protein [Oculatella sp. LEGE 06141]MBE9180906.1 phage tail protein [Oculatella sp. LEGE 06141]